MILGHYLSACVKYLVSVNPLLECWPSADGFAWPRSYWRLLSVPPSVLEILSSSNVQLVQLTGCAAAVSSEEGEESPHMYAALHMI